MLVLFLCSAMPVHAAIIQGVNGLGGSTKSWYSSNDWERVLNSPAGAGSQGVWMNTTWVNSDVINKSEGSVSKRWVDVFSKDAVNMFAVTFDEGMWPSMSLWASNNAYEATMSQWSTEGSNLVWKHSVFDVSAHDMESQVLTSSRADYLLNKTDLSMAFLTEQHLIDELTSVDWVGIRIWRGEMSSDRYGIDSSHLMIPEPAEIILLLFAGISSFMTLRRKRRVAVATEGCSSVAGSST